MRDVMRALAAPRGEIIFTGLRVFAIERHLLSYESPRRKSRRLAMMCRMILSSPGRRPVRKRIYALFAAFNLVIAVLIVLIAEGVLSFFAPTHWRNLTERKHCEFDPLLGWVNLQSMNVPDLYGPGLGLTTNARGFRGEREIEDEIPMGKTRIVCSGDSFTLG